MTTTCWFVAPETERIDIAEGQWIEVKKALSGISSAESTPQRRPARSSSWM